MQNPKLLLLSGLLCDDLVWRSVARDVSGSIAIRAFPGFSSIRDMAHAALESAPERFALAGHSMGARVALEMVRMAPDRVTRLALLNTGIHPVAPHEPETRGRLVALAHERGMRALADIWLPPMMGSGISDSALMSCLRAMVERQSPESFAGQIRALLTRPEAESVLVGVAVPLLLVAAEADRWSPVAQHEAMCAHQPAARLVVIENAGHMAPVEAPREVAAAIEDWLHW